MSNPAFDLVAKDAPPVRESLWPATLRRLYAALGAAPGDDVSRASFLAPGDSAPAVPASGGAAEPLSEALEPLCRFAWSELRRRLASPPRLLTAQAVQDLQDALREDLARLFGPVVAVEAGIELAAGGGTARPPAALARAAFADRDSLFTLFASYPVLARLCATLIDRWTATVYDLLTRLAADRGVIAPLLGAAEQPLVAAISWDERPAVLGRPDLLLRFTARGRIRYVPRPVSSHDAFARLVAWLNACGAPHEICTSAVMDRGTYGWVEHVQPEPCRDEGDVARFYRRAGALVFLAWVLRATDLGNQDVVARGAQPVLTRPRVLQHRLIHTPVSLLEDTVLSTGLIGAWRIVGRGFQDVSAFPLGTRHGHCRVAASWSGLDAGPPRIQLRTVPVAFTDHLPHLGGRPEPVSAHAAELVLGFRETFAWFLRHRDRLLRDGTPLAELLSRPVEVAAYDQPGARLRSLRATSPSLLQDRAAHRAAAETSSRRFLSGICDGLPGTGPLIAAEARATASLALPSLTAHPASTLVRVQEEGAAVDVAGLLRAPSAGDVRARLQGLSLAGCEEQARLLWTAVDGPRLALAQGLPDDHPAAGDVWVREALALAEQIVKGAARTSCGAPTWLTVAERPSRGLYQPTPLPPEGLLAQGGIAIFLAAAGRVAGRPDLRQHALQALDPIRSWLFGDRIAGGGGGSPSIPPDLPNGAMFGVGSLVYTLTVAGRLAGDGGLIEDALALARQVTAARVRSDTVHDIYSGNAGLALALAALYDVTREAWIAPVLRAAGEHLLANRVAAGESRSWGTPPLAGFSHGAAGISYALARAFEVTGHRPLLAAAREAIAYEHGLFAPDRGQWRDLRAPGSFMCSWCHGAPGIALARASVLGTLDDAVVREDLERAVQATLEWPLESLDHLCCGNAGRVECLWVAAGRTGDAPLRDAVLTLASRVYAAALARGRYAVDWPGTQDSPTFLRGLAGIGYQWLRLADPSLPSVLALA